VALLPIIKVLRIVLLLSTFLYRLVAAAQIFAFLLSPGHRHPHRSRALAVVKAKGQNSNTFEKDLNAVTKIAIASIKF